MSVHDSAHLPSPSLGAFSFQTRTGVARILIDCSLARFDGQPTGIPRVVLNYARHGRAFGQRSGISVVPVELAFDDRLRVRALPGEKLASANWATAPRTAVVVLTFKIFLEILRYFTRIAIAVLALLRAVVPSRALIKATRALSRRLQFLRPRMRLKLERIRRDVAHVNPGLGDVVLCPSLWHDIDSAVYETLHARGAEIIFVLHDIAPVTNPAYYYFPWRWKFEQRLARSLEYVAHYYCVSNKTLLDLTEFAAHRRKTIHASVAYNGFESLIEQAHTLAGTAYAALFQRRPWLMVGTLEPKKGYRDALAAFDVLWAGGYQRPLVVVGRRGWICDDIVETFQTSRWLGDRFFWFDAVGDAELATFYCQAHALLFASYVEGFGLPLLEAASHGLPILARDTPTPREILGSHGTFFTAADDLISGIKALEDPATLDAARERIKRLTWFDWCTVVESVMVDILRRPEERRTGVNLLDSSLILPVCRTHSTTQSFGQPGMIEVQSRIS
jgi:glycosyltransferase involved in cell wall biosynthesis